MNRVLTNLPNIEEYTCFKFHGIPNLTGIRKISHKHELQRIQNLKQDGHKYLGANGQCVYFAIHKVLMRNIKLSKISSGAIHYNIKFLIEVIDRSKIVDDINELNGIYDWGDATDCIFDGWTLWSVNRNFEELEYKKENQKYKRKHQDNLYKMRGKR